MIAVTLSLMAALDKRVITGTINKAIQFDSNTLDYGIRSNGGPDAKVGPGGVGRDLSFTVGAGVIDAQAWPAQVQQLTGNVNNAVQGGDAHEPRMSLIPSSTAEVPARLAVPPPKSSNSMIGQQIPGP